MAYLLDTHTLLWQLGEPEKLSDNVRDIIIKKDNELVVSMVSFWEIAIKCGLERIEFNSSFTDIEAVLKQYNIQLLKIEFAHLEIYRNLPFIHKDPFDRLLITQAVANDLIILTRDSFIKQYQVKTLW